jgi:hypothetical protein
VTLAILTPFTGTEAVELGNRFWRKKVLPVGEVEYQGRILKFTRDYLGRLVQSFKDAAYDQVPFQLADSKNTHTNDPDRTRGWVKAMELGDDGLYVVAEVTPDGEEVLSKNPRLGVSARIVEDYARSDGLRFPAAIQHVLGTLDPRIPGLGAWQAIEAATPEPDTVVDLSAAMFAGEEPPAAPTQPQVRTDDGMPDLGNLTDAQRARLAALLDLPDETLSALASGGLVVTPEELDALTAPDAGGDDELSDEDLDALIAAAGELDDAGLLGDELPLEEEREPVAAGLSQEAQFMIDMATAETAETKRELAVITARLQEEDFQGEKRRLADLGVPPYITELARPLLEGAGHAVELANGKTVDAGAIARRVLTEYARQARLLDLDVELGSPLDEPEGEMVRAEQDESRADLVSRYKAVTGLK